MVEQSSTFVTPGEASEILSARGLVLTPDGIRAACDRGELAALRTPTRRRLISMAALRAFVTARLQRQSEQRR